MRQNLTATEIQRMCLKTALTKRGENTTRLARKKIAFTALIFSVDGIMARESKFFSESWRTDSLLNGTNHTALS